MSCVGGDGRSGSLDEVILTTFKGSLAPKTECSSFCVHFWGWECVNSEFCRELQPQLH